MSIDEVELKFLDIDTENIKQKIIDLGAILTYDTTMESYSFLAEGFHASNSNMKSLRIRKIDNEAVITYKDPAKQADMTIREEIEIKVDDYNTAINLLEKLNFKKTEVFKKHRVHYELGDIHFELDTLDNVPTYLEIETQTIDAMRQICIDLGLDIINGKKGTIVEILPELFDEY